MKSCAFCGTPLSQRPNETDSNWRRRTTCNRSCGARFAGKKHREKHKKNTPIARCIVCNNAIESPNPNRRTTCSPACRLKAHYDKLVVGKRTKKPFTILPGGRFNINGVSRDPLSQYHGVIWDRDTEAWVAVVFDGRSTHWIGPFERDDDAAHEYDDVARRFYGEHARLNFGER